ncbi:MAG TPA: pyridoxamine 5'-phosphate oxidase [Lacunisphaera sp.]|nr:pyridoxamine 5'-phosphate oxidase [Lacunisphaera sp.]
MPLPDPLRLFQEWFAEARDRERTDATAMALATADASGQPAVRMVLLKAVDARGLVFYTNLGSPKAENLRANPRAELCFHWPVLERQVRVAGMVEAVTDEEADGYFATRPRLSQLGAWASWQSKPMNGRYELERAVARESVRFGLGRVPRPAFWSGFRVVPARFEFWQQRPFRHHDRERYTRIGEKWHHEWLYP